MNEKQFCKCGAEATNHIYGIPVCKNLIQTGNCNDFEEQESGMCDYCHKNYAYKSNGQSKLECYNRAMYGQCEGLKPRTGKAEPSRNAVCPCGSGKKYKRCCLNKKTEPEKIHDMCSNVPMGVNVSCDENYQAPETKVTVVTNSDGRTIIKEALTNMKLRHRQAVSVQDANYVPPPSTYTAFDENGVSYTINL